MLQRTEHFDMQVAQENTIYFLSSFMPPTAAEINFWQTFNNKEYRPDLIFLIRFSWITSYNTQWQFGNVGNKIKSHQKCDFEWLFVTYFKMEAFRQFGFQ